MNPSTTIIVRARPEQADALTRIALAAKRHWGYPERWIKIWTPLLTITPEFITANEVWAAAIDGRAVAFYALLENGDQASLEHLWVEPEFMGRGIGRDLFEHACARARALGHPVLIVEADPHAQGFYEHMGGRVTGQQIGEVDGAPRVLPILEFDL